MHYKTIVLEILQQHPEIYDHFRRNRTLLVTLDRYAKELKANHEIWKDRLSQAKPRSDPSQIASEALEIALKELENFLDQASPPNDGKPPSLDGAMAFIRRHTPPDALLKP